MYVFPTMDGVHVVAVYLKLSDLLRVELSISVF